MSAAPFIADPARDPDGQLHLQIAFEFRGAAGKTMCHGAGESRAMLADNRDETRIPTTLMQKHGLASGGGELQLAPEGIPLRRWRGQVAVVVKSALTDG